MKLIMVALLVLVTSIYSQVSTKTSLNSNWMFTKNNIDNLSIIDGANWDRVNLPHTWNDKDVLDDEPGYYQGNGWYKKQFFVEKNKEDKNIYILFEGVNQTAEVYINNSKIGSHKGGYTAFTFDISNYLKFGEVNEILVKANNEINLDIPPLSGDFTFYGGIYRDVWLIEKNNIHFDTGTYASSGVFISTPKVSNKSGTVSILGQLINQSQNDRIIEVVSKIFDRENKFISESITKTKLESSSKKEFVLENIIIKNPNLWSIESPYLYKIITQIINSDTEEILDEVINPLGFRYYEFDSDKGFSLNGEHVKIIGVSRHQDYSDLGNALSNEFHVKDIQMIKEMGANFLRVSHYPQDPTILEMCDRLGILASVEVPLVNDITLSEDFFTNSHNMMKEMIYQNGNHPSVIVWCYMNEILLGYKRKTKNDPNAYAVNYLNEVERLASEMDSIAKSIDPDRYTMIVNHGELDLYGNAGLAEVADINAWNLYAGWYGDDYTELDEFLDKHHIRYPNRSVMIGEYGAGVDPRLRSYSPIRFDFTQDYSIKYHRYVVDAMNDRPFVTGGLVWNFADFGSEFRVDAVPHINSKGLVSFNRTPKDAYYLYQALLKKEPISLIGSKYWRFRTGIKDYNSNFSKQNIDVYSNLDSVLLKNNNELIGTKLVENGVASFSVPFCNGKNFLQSFAFSDNRKAIDKAIINFKLLPNNLNENSDWDIIAVNLGDHRYFYDDKAGLIWIPDKEYEKGSWGYVGGEAYYKKTSFQSQTFMKKSQADKKNEVVINLKTRFGTEKNIFGTDNDPLFQSQLQGFKEYKFDIPDGKYELQFYLAELEVDSETLELIYNLGNDFISENNPKERVFDISINGQKVIANLNLAKSVGPERAVIEKVEYNVHDGKGIKITLDSNGVPGFINAILLRKII